MKTGRLNRAQPYESAACLNYTYLKDSIMLDIFLLVILCATVVALPIANFINQSFEITVWISEFAGVSAIALWFAGRIDD